MREGRKNGRARTGLSADTAPGVAERETPRTVLLRTQEGWIRTRWSSATFALDALPVVGRASSRWTRFQSLDALPVTGRPQHAHHTEH
jgi:hypothetical protein